MFMFHNENENRESRKKDFEGNERLRSFDYF